jgi:signal transduction histidine kinase
MGDRKDKVISIFLKKEKSALLTIEDNGIGISRENLPKLFQKFFRVQDGKMKGTGLGLPICKRIVEIHGGKIEVDSKLGEGTKFSIKLNLVPG